MKRRTNISPIFMLLSLTGILIMLFVANGFAQPLEYSWGRGLSASANGTIKQRVVASDRHNNVIIGGNFTDSLKFAETSFSGDGMYVIKYDANGNAIYHSFIGSQQSGFHDTVLDIATDSSDNIYILAYRTPYSSYDGQYYLMKFDSAFQFISNYNYASVEFTTNTAYVKGNCAVSPDQSVYVSFAYQNSATIPNLSQLSTNNSLNYAFAMVHISSNGTPLTYLTFKGQKPWIEDISCAQQGAGQSFNKVSFTGTFDASGMVVFGSAGYSATINGNNVINAFSGATVTGAAANTSIYNMVSFFASRPGYIKPTAITTDKIGQSFIVGRFAGDALCAGTSHDTLRSITVANDTDVFYAKDSLGIVLAWGKVIQATGNDKAGDIISLNDTSILLSAMFANNGVVLAGNAMRAGSVLLAVNKYMVVPNQGSTGGIPRWTMQQQTPFGCDINGIAKGTDTTFYTAGRINATGLFGRDTLKNNSAAGDSIGFVGKVGTPRVCNLQTKIFYDGRDTIYSNYSPLQLSPTFTGAYDFAKVHYAWSTGDTIKNKSVNKRVHGEKWTFSVTDTKGCVGRDTIVVFNYVNVTDTAYICNHSSATLHLDSLVSSAGFSWTGNTLDSTSTLVVNAAGNYLGVAKYYIGSGANTTNEATTFLVIDTCTPTCNLLWGGMPVGSVDTLQSWNYTGMLQNGYNILDFPISNSSGHVGYSWSPAYLFYNPHSPLPVFNRHMVAQPITVTVTDSLTNCLLNQQLLVTILDTSPSHQDTIYKCGSNPAVLDLGIAQNYYWFNTTPADSNRTRSVTTAGTYNGSATYKFYNTGGFYTINIVRSFVVMDSCTTCHLSTIISPATDTILQCQTASPISTNTTGGSGNYSYSWTPTNNLTGATQPTVTITKQVDMQKLFVTVTDNATGCTAKDTVVVGAYLVHNDTLASCNGSLVILNLGPGATTYNWVSPFGTQQTLTVSAAGTYHGVATYSHVYANCGAMTSTFLVRDTCATNCNAGVKISKGGTAIRTDTVTICNRNAAIVANVTGTNNYVVNWAPSNYFQNTTDIVQDIGKHINLKKVYVTITDNITGCVARDSIVLNNYFGSGDTINVCTSHLETFDLGEGANSYVWSTGATTQTITAALPGAYDATATYPTCGAQVSHYIITDTCATVPDLVWPGDANSNGTADLYDVLNIGIGYNNTGPVRSSASTAWVGQPATDWQLQFLNSVNLKHADCDGNGVIDSFDVDVVAQNYGLTHAKTDDAQANPANPDLYVQFNIDSATNRNLVTANVFLGRISQPVSNGYGLAYSVLYDPAIVDTNVTVSYAGSWLGQNDYPVHLVKNAHANGKIDLAYSRTNHSNIAGYGQVATISFYIQDNIIGKEQELFKKLALQISGAKLVDKDGVEVDINVQNDTMVVYQGINDAANALVQVEVYPNPSNGAFYLSLKGNEAITTVTLINALGQTVTTKQYAQRSNIYQFDSGTQPAGMYFLKIETSSSQSMKRVIIGQ